MLAVPVFGRPDFESAPLARFMRNELSSQSFSQSFSRSLFVFPPLCLTAPERPRHSWMLDVAKKMLGSRARAGVRHDDAAAQLRRQL
jgi:hypothetical protein